MDNFDQFNILEHLTSDVNHACTSCDTIKSKFRQKKKQITHLQDELKRIKSFNYVLQNQVSSKNTGSAVRIIIKLFRNRKCT